LLNYFNKANISFNILKKHPRKTNNNNNNNNNNNDKIRHIFLPPSTSDLKNLLRQQLKSSVGIFRQSAAKIPEEE